MVPGTGGSKIPASAAGTVAHMRTTQRKGDIATTQAIATFTALGCDVSIPVTESAAYDLVIDDSGVMARVQCKFATSRDVDLRRIHSNAGGYVVKTVLANAYDWLYVLRPDGTEYLVRECHEGRRSFTPQDHHRISRPRQTSTSRAA